jgi:hypothetical protein
MYNFGVLLNTGMNTRFQNGYKPSRVSFVISSEKLIHTVNQQRRQKPALREWRVRKPGTRKSRTP